MSARQMNRFQMLINIAVGGGRHLNKIGSDAKKAAIGFSGFSKAIKGSNVVVEESVARLGVYGKKLNSLEREYKKLLTAQDRYRATEGKSNVVRDRARERMIAQSQAFKKLTLEVNKGAKSLVHYDARTKKFTRDEVELRKQANLVTKTIRGLNKEMKQGTKITTKYAKSQDKLQRELRQTTIATKKVTHQFEKWDDQRIGAGHGLTVFRRSLGAIRNQLLVLAFATAGVRKVFRATFTASKELESALRGLTSVSINLGIGASKAREAAVDLADKGLMSVKEASAGLKNLLSAGFGLPEAIDLMNTLTDAAAFNRQGTLELGEAVVGATQGIKNQNSIMVDNAGITKNLSIMYKEYAVTIGTTGGKLTEVQKRQAIYNGILKEGAIFAGDASKVLGTLSGRMSKLSVQTTKSAAAVGNIMKPAINEIVAVFLELQVVIAETFSEENFKIEVMEKARNIGRSLAESLRSLGEIVVALSKPVQAIVSATGGWGTWIKTILGVMVVLKAKNLLLHRSAAALKVAETTSLTYARATNIATRQTEIFNFTTGQQVLGTRKLSIAYRLAKIELLGLAKAEKVAISQTAVLTGMWAKLVVTLKRGTIGLRASAIAIRSVGGATRALAFGIRALVASLGPMLIAFAAFEALSWVYNKFFGRGEEREKAEDIDRMVSSLEDYLNKIQSLSSQGEGLGKKGAALGLLVDQEQIDRAQASLETSINAMIIMAKRFGEGLFFKDDKSGFLLYYTRARESIKLSEEDYRAYLKSISILIAEEVIKFEEAAAAKINSVKASRLALRGLLRTTAVSTRAATLDAQTEAAQRNLDAERALVDLRIDLIDLNQQEALSYRSLISGLNEYNKSQNDQLVARAQLVSQLKLEKQAMIDNLAVKEKELALLIAGAGNATISKEQRERLESRIALLKLETGAMSEQIGIFSQIADLKLKMFDKEQVAEQQVQVKAFIDSLNDTINTAWNFVSSWADIKNQIVMEEKRSNADLRREMDKRNLSMEEQNRILTANHKKFAAKQKLEEAKFTADLVREVGRQIQIYAARKAAASGNIVAAMGLLAAGFAGMAVANKYARDIERAAQVKYDRAVESFETTKAEVFEEAKIRDEAASQAARKLGGTIKAQNLSVTIAPVISIIGETIFIGQGSVTEFGHELQALMIQASQDAIDNRQLDLSNISNLG